MTHNKFFSKFILVVALSMGATYCDDSGSDLGSCAATGSAAGSDAKASFLAAKNLGLAAAGLVAVGLVVYGVQKFIAARKTKAVDLAQPVAPKASSTQANAGQTTRRASFFGMGS